MGTIPLGRCRAALAVMMLGASLPGPWHQPDHGGLPAPPGWTALFAEDFEGPAGAPPDPQRWRFSIGHGYPGGPPNWGTGEVAYHTDDPANVSLDGTGQLLITPLRDAAGAWTSARIETNQRDFRPPPGGVMRIEARLRLPAVTGDAAAGYWPAFWALGAPYRDSIDTYPMIGELDFMENANGADRVWGHLHCGTPEEPCGGPDGFGGSRACPGSPCPGNFHRYTFEWDARDSPQRLRWSMDGERFHTVDQDQLTVAQWQGITGHRGFFLLLNLAIGGGFPDALAGTTTPTPATEPGHPLAVDYVGVWTRAG